MKRLPAFSVILVFVVLVIVGAGMIPLLNIQYAPTKKGSELRINVNWPNASAKLVEMEVTSKLEGLVASVNGIQEISSVSGKGYGTITVTIKDKDRMEAIRFEISSLIRQIYNKFPPGVYYPSISGSSAGVNSRSILVFQVNADIPTQQIETYVKEHIIKDLAMVPGVSSVDLSGATPFYREVAFDPHKMEAMGININELYSALSGAFKDYNVVGTMNQTGILLKSDVDPEELEKIPVKSVDGRIIRVSDVAKIQYKEKTPESYFRINGLNTINISVRPERFINTLDVCKAVKQKVKDMEPGFPEKFSVMVSYDSSVNLKKELNKVIRRTVLSLLILLAFVFAVSRSLKYLFVITFALVANIFIAFIFYVWFDLEIHLYSLAGITVSLGIIIDTSIIMISHYGYYKNKKVFIAILAAQMTSIGALIVVFLLPEEQRANLMDFSAVIIINLAISLLISMLLIPALVDTVGIREKEILNGYRNKRWVIRFDRWYSRYIYYAKKYKWASFVILILGFGLPVSKLPEKLGNEAKKSYYNQADNKPEKKDNLAIKVYNKTLGSDFFNNKVKEKADKVMGGSLRLFLKNITTYGGGSREVERPTLYVSASLPDGCTASQLNEIVLSMENYLAQFEEIEQFTTTVYGGGNVTANIVITFKREVENTYFPIMLKQEIISKAIVFGGANWSVYGIDQNPFSNNVYSAYKSERIILTGYNYDQLYAYCRMAVDELSKNRRVNGADVYGNVSYGSTLSRSEYFIDFNPYRLAVNKLSLSDAYSALEGQLYGAEVGKYYKNNEKISVDIVSANKEYYDAWNLRNEYMKIGDKNIRFSDIGDISKRNSGNNIYRKDQQYSLYVAYDYVGSYDLASRVRKRTIDWLNDSVLPIGYKASETSWGWSSTDSNKIVLLLIIIAIIYFICAILFESLRYPLIIIGLIPVSFIGVFLIFYFTGCMFDQGGFASLVMLSGIVVNAGIYILNEYKGQTERRKSRAVLAEPTASKTEFFYPYIRAFNHKIIPIMLTVLSTLLGLLPFLFDGKSEVFWFAFALGTIGGLFFSLIALVLFMPIWVPRK